MSSYLLKSRWMIFVVGMLIGMLLLVACGAATQTAVAPTEETETTGGQAPETEEAAPETGQPGDEPTTVSEAPQPQAGGLLGEVQSRGVLRCGVNLELPGFSTISSEGVNQGFDVDFCRAVAAAIFADANAVEFTQLNADQRFPALQTGEIDVLIRNTTWTLTRDADLGLDFTVTNFYDGQGYAVRADEFSSVEELNGGTVCVQSGTTTELNLADDFEGRGLDYEAKVFSEASETFSGFFEGQCDAVTSDKSQLASYIAVQENASDYAILPDTISKEPLGPVVRANDSDWRDVVSWTVYAMLQAEELGINQENVDDMLDSGDIQVQRLLGTGDDDLGALLGLPKDWAYQIIKLVGSYGDVYERNLAPLGLARENTLNALWTDGGLMYAPAFR